MLDPGALFRPTLWRTGEIWRLRYSPDLREEARTELVVGVFPISNPATLREKPGNNGAPAFRAGVQLVGRVRATSPHYILRRWIPLHGSSRSVGNYVVPFILPMIASRLSLPVNRHRLRLCWASCSTSAGNGLGPSNTATEACGSNRTGSWKGTLVPASCLTAWHSG